MSDFLFNLAARALGEAPVVRPRTPGLFEPATVGALVEDSTALDAAKGSRPLEGSAASEDTVNSRPDRYPIEASQINAKPPVGRSTSALQIAADERPTVRRVGGGVADSIPAPPHDRSNDAARRDEMDDQRALASVVIAQSAEPPPSLAVPVRNRPAVLEPSAAQRRR